MKKKSVQFLLPILVMSFLAACTNGSAPPPAGEIQKIPDGLGGSFDVTQRSIPLEEIQSGGPPRDGIPSLDAPKFVPASDATFLKDEDRVMGVIEEGEARAYPLKILTYHEVVNDKLADEPIAVSY